MKFDNFQNTKLLRQIVFPFAYKKNITKNEKISSESIYISVNLKAQTVRKLQTTLPCSTKALPFN